MERPLAELFEDNNITNNSDTVEFFLDEFGDRNLNSTEQIYNHDLRLLILNTPIPKLMYMGKSGSGDFLIESAYEQFHYQHDCWTGFGN